MYKMKAIEVKVRQDLFDLVKKMFLMFLLVLTARSGKVKGIERFLGAVEAVEHSLMEVTSGQAKYEHQHRSIVWRIARLPKEGQADSHYYFDFLTRRFLHIYSDSKKEPIKGYIKR
ncbi:unnamed protein product, partial [Allacma fusca]